MTQKIEQVYFDENIETIDPANVRQVTLASGRDMPVAAYGTFHSDWAQDYMKDATAEAIRLGWRHLDTARAYENEGVVGEAIRQAIKAGSIASASDLFITGKLWNGHMAPKDVAPAMDVTLKALGVDQIDMYLNHWPWPNVHTPGCASDHRNPSAVPYIHEAFMETWAEICKLKKAGKVMRSGEIYTRGGRSGDVSMSVTGRPAIERTSCNNESFPLSPRIGLPAAIGPRGRPNCSEVAVRNG